MCSKDILKLCCALISFVAVSVFLIVVTILAPFWAALSWIVNGLLYCFHAIRGGQPTKPHDLEEGSSSSDMVLTSHTSDLAAAAAASASLLATIDEIGARDTVPRNLTRQLSSPPPYHQVPSSPPEYQTFDSASPTEMTCSFHVAMAVPQPCARIDGRSRESRVRSHRPLFYGHV